MHKLSVLAVRGFVAMDLAIPVDIFSRSVSRFGENLYEVSVCSNKQEIDRGLFAFKAKYDLSALLQTDTIVIPGVEDIENPADADVISELQQAAANGVRIASICTGAFVLAKAGLLDGLRATTHWRGAAELAA